MLNHARHLSSRSRGPAWKRVCTAGSAGTPPEKDASKRPLAMLAALLGISLRESLIQSRKVPSALTSLATLWRAVPLRGLAGDAMGRSATPAAPPPDSRGLGGGLGSSYAAAAICDTITHSLPQSSHHSWD